MKTLTWPPKPHPAGHPAGHPPGPPAGPLDRPRARPPADLGEHLEGLRGAVGDLAGMIRALVPVVLDTTTVTLDAAGSAHREFRVPYSALSVASASKSLLLVTSAPYGQQPGPGPGSAIIHPGGFGVANFRGYAWSVYGGAAGDQVTITAYGTPVPPSGAPGQVVATFPSAQQVVATFPSAQPVIAQAYGQASLANAGAVTNPAGGAVIATVTAAVAGLYLVKWLVGLGGTTAAGDANNFALQRNAVLLTGSVNSSTSGASVPNQSDVYVRCNAGDTINVAAIAPAGAATSVYRAQIVATQVGP